MSDKESLRRELSAIVKVDGKGNYDNKNLVNKVLIYVKTHQLNQTAYGQEFERRLNELKTKSVDELSPFSCIVCNNPSMKKMLCPTCTKKLLGNASNQRQQSAKDQKSGNVNKSNNTTNNDLVNTTKTFVNNRVDKLTERVNVMIGGEGKVDLRVKDLFSQVFKKHSKNEADMIFTCGTEHTTPSAERISTEWPRPWLFSRVMLVFIVAFLVLIGIYSFFGNTNAIPGIMFIGSLAIPFSMLIFLFEINVPRNISIFRVVLVFMLGGTISLFVTLILYRINPSGDMTIGYAVFVGIVEEIGKIIILAYTMNRLQTTKYILNGLLIGGAVGAGFAFFESAGYAFNAYMNFTYYGISTISNASSVSNMVANILLRGFLSPGGHVAWAAMEGAFLVIVLHGKQFKWSSIVSPAFISLCLIPIAMHAFWDMPILNMYIGRIPMKMVGLEILALIIILVILHRGLSQINEIQKQ